MIIKIDNEKKLEIMGSRARATRDALLVETDWRVAADRPDTKQWMDYRQALRDLTKQPGFPKIITWPDPPSS